MPFSDKIHAIKALRDLPKVNTDITEVCKTENGVTTIKVPTATIGLKDAKDFVEAVMAMAAPSNPLVIFQLVREGVMDRAIIFQTPEHVGYYTTHAKAIAARDNIQRLRAYNHHGIWESSDDFYIKEFSLNA